MAAAAALRSSMSSSPIGASKLLPVATAAALDRPPAAPSPDGSPPSGIIFSTVELSQLVVLDQSPPTPVPVLLHQPRASSEAFGDGG
eukprot:scaffold17748_cov85-Isochrysis_galbana.AAC.4